MYARHRAEFTAPRPGGYSSETPTTVEPGDFAAARQLAARARATELKRLFGQFARRIGDLVLSRRRWSV